MTQQKNEPAWKQDGGKPRMDLIAPEMLVATANVLAYGAKKYSFEVENEWHGLLLADHVESLRLLTPEGCAVSVMKSTCGRPILSLQSASGRTDATGRQETQIECENWQNAGVAILKLAHGTSGPNGVLPFASTDFLNRTTSDFAPRAALFAAQSSTCTLTIATTRGAFEVYFAPDAITDSGFWTTVWRDLNVRFGISRPRSQTGERNWEKGMSWGRCFGAMMRHMWAWWGGEKVDAETGYSHLHHAAACLMFLIAYEERQIGTDDRKNPVDNP